MHEVVASEAGPRAAVSIGESPHWETVALAVAGWIAGMTPSLFMSQEGTVQDEPGLGVVLLLAAIAGAAAGLCFGGAQWFILRRHA